MEEELITITPDRERVKSILKMVETREKRIAQTAIEDFASLLIEDYYEIIKELATALINLEGNKTLSHKALFEHVRTTYEVFKPEETAFLDELRKLRNQIVYEGFFVKAEYVTRNQEIINDCVTKLKNLIKQQLQTSN